MKTSTAKQNGWRCPVCGDETSRDPGGRGYVKHKTNRTCRFEKGMKDQEPSSFKAGPEVRAEQPDASHELIESKPGGMATRFLSYGEDPLTFWALRFRLDEILRQLGDPAALDQVLVIYRPSFGRQGKPKVLDPNSVARAEFGEFDAIIGTPTCVYLVESKWSSSGEVKGELLDLRPEQVHRHQVFRWYLETWRTQPPASWDDFFAKYSGRFQKTFPGNKLAPPESKLAENLQFVLTELTRHGRLIRDVLLFISLPGLGSPLRVEKERFSLVSLQFEPLTRTGYFEMTL